MRSATRYREARPSLFASLFVVLAVFVIEFHQFETGTVSALCDQHELLQGLRCCKANALLEASKAIQQTTTDTSTNLYCYTPSTENGQISPSAFFLALPLSTFSQEPVIGRYIALEASVRGLKNISIDIPLAVAAGTTVNMSCGYDLESDTLYVMKWYYKGSEFFRYVPKELPPTSTFGELGNKVILNKSDDHRVVLRDLQPNYTGKYLCEVSGDSPSFTTLVDLAYMHVANLPNGEPQVRVEKVRYAVGDTVRANCTVPSGNPPANVTWTVNGVPVNSSFIMNVTDKLSDNQQIMCIAGLDFEIIPDSFNNGRLHIVCNANVFHLYKKQAGVFLIEERPRLASVLGTRESSYIGGAATQFKEWFLNAAVTLLLCSFR